MDPTDTEPAVVLDYNFSKYQSEASSQSFHGTESDTNQKPYDHFVLSNDSENDANVHTEDIEYIEDNLYSENHIGQKFNVESDDGASLSLSSQSTSRDIEAQLTPSSSSSSSESSSSSSLSKRVRFARKETTWSAACVISDLKITAKKDAETSMPCPSHSFCAGPAFFQRDELVTIRNLGDAEEGEGHVEYFDGVILQRSRAFRQRLGQLVTALLNLPQGGQLWWGVDPDGGAQGVSLGRPAEDRLRLDIDDVMRGVAPTVPPGRYRVLLAGIMGGDGRLEADVKVLCVAVRPQARLMEDMLASRCRGAPPASCDPGPGAAPVVSSSSTVLPKPRYDYKNVVWVMRDGRLQEMETRGRRWLEAEDNTESFG